MYLPHLDEITQAISPETGQHTKTDTDGTQRTPSNGAGSVEVFPDADLAKGRAEYIQGVLKNSGFRGQSTTTHTDLFWCGSRPTSAPRPCASDRGSVIRLVGTLPLVKDPCASWARS
jgi:hypothetical protein